MKKWINNKIRTIPKRLKMRWVWFRHNHDRDWSRDKFGILVLDRWVISYYKGSVVLWHASKLKIEASDSFANLHVGIQIDDYISKKEFAKK